MRAASLSLLAELGQTEQALAEPGPTADRVQATGDKSFTLARRAAAPARGTWHA